MSLYEERKQRLIDAANLTEPDIVPIVSSIQTYAVSYAGAKIEDILQDPSKEFDIYAKYIKDIYFDGISSFGTFPMYLNAEKTLGYAPYFVSPDGETVQYRDRPLLRGDDYEKLASDYRSFTRNELLPRRYPLLGKYPENVEHMRAFLKELTAYLQNSAIYPERLKNELEMPYFGGLGKVSSALCDMVNMRSYSGLMMDLRRHPKELKKALEVMCARNVMVARGDGSPLPEFSWAFMPITSVPDLPRKLFDEFFWPYFEPAARAYAERGGKVYLVFEGKCSKFYDRFLELPKGSVILNLQEDDVIEAKKAIGHHVTICGGITLDMLKYESREACIEQAKKVIDACAPGGGFIFSTNKMVISKNDIKAENLKAVNEFVHEYGHR